MAAGETGVRFIKRMANPFSKPIRERFSEDIKEYAEQFYCAAEILRDQPSSAGVSTACIVNASLSIELFLKALCSERRFHNVKDHKNGLFSCEMTSSPVVKSHSLTKIWNEIPSDIKNKARVEFKKTILFEEYQQIESVLKIYNQTFEQQRYSFENINNSVFNITKLFYLLYFIRNLVLGIEEAIDN